jgi:FeS assembly SUF system regulator
MLRISKMTDYGILAMVELARDGGVLSAQRLSERIHIETPTVSKVLKMLTHSGLVASSRGASGGYRVAKDADKINVAEIIAAIEGPIAMTECSVEQGLCSVEHSCTMRSNWQRISVAVAGALQKVSLSEMSMPIHFDPGVLHIATLNMTEKRV